MKILVIGGTGFVGKHLCRELTAAGYETVVLSRDEARARITLGEVGNNVKVIGWDGPTSTMPQEALEDVDGIVNLAGESIGEGRWTRAKKAKILNSRVKTTRAVVDGSKSLPVKPKVLVNASAVGFYGPSGDTEKTEKDPPGSDFLATVCQAWEEEAFKAMEYGVRVVTLRIGVVLGNGGALARMALPFRFYLGGSLGKGNQWLSWVCVNDLVGIIKFALENETVVGPVNATAPQPQKMRNFCATLGQVMGKPSWLNLPDFALRLALGEMSDMLLTGQRALPEKIIEAGYNFKYPQLREALADIFT